jgi:hypothetical protein
MVPAHLVARLGFSPGHVDTSRVASGLTTPGPTPEDLFNALDGRELIVLGQRWKVEVFSVCALGGCRYMQLSLQGDQQYMLTLRVTTGAEIPHLVPKLIAWLAHPSSSGEILEIG